jgi:hypothetical protein
MRLRHIGTALAVALLATAGHAFAQADRIQWTGSIARGETLTVNAIAGSIDAEPSNDGQIHLEAVLSDPSRVRVDIAQRGNGVTVCAVYFDSDGRPSSEDCEANRGSRFGRDDDTRWRELPTVAYRLRVPAGVRLSTQLVNGDVRVDDVRASVKATTVSGNVEVRTAGFATEATTVSGDVRLEVAAGANANVDATTVSGSIESDFPLVTEARIRGGFNPRGRSGPRSVHGTIGNGGAGLRATTVSGSIEIRRR